VKQMLGKVGEAIVEAAKEENAHLIIVGTRGMGKVRRTFLGSVSDYCIHHAGVPVLVCRHKDSHKESE
jgi:nucleotide-binding universal stress UspA family protein